MLLGVNRHADSESGLRFHDYLCKIREIVITVNLKIPIFKKHWKTIEWRPLLTIFKFKTIGLRGEDTRPNLEEKRFQIVSVLVVNLLHWRFFRIIHKRLYWKSQKYLKKGGKKLKKIYFWSKKRHFWAWNPSKQAFFDKKSIFLKNDVWYDETVLRLKQHV